MVLLVDWPTGNDCLEAASFRFWPLLYFTSSIVRPVCVDAGRVQEQEMVSEMAREIVLRVYEKVLCISEIVCLLVCVCVREYVIILLLLCWRCFRSSFISFVEEC